MSVIGRLARLTGHMIPAALARPFGQPTAVFFHGVESRITDPGLQINQHSFDAFETMARLLRRDFNVLPLGAIGDVLKNPERHSRALFLMSDDGYANLLPNAAPVLRALNLPWTLFVSTHHIDSGDFTPPTLTRIFFQDAPAGHYALPHLTPFDLDDRETLSAECWKQLKNMDAALAGETLAAMRKVLDASGADLKARYSSETFLNWDQVRMLHNQGVEIGAHADWHWPMHQNQSPEWLREQAVHSKARVEKEVGPCRFFAYPFGQRADVCQGAWKAARDAGFEYAFTTMAGTLEASANRFLLPRYGLAAEESNLAAFLPVLRANNAKLRSWQSQIGTDVQNRDRSG